MMCDTYRLFQQPLSFIDGIDYIDVYTISNRDQKHKQTLNALVLVLVLCACTW